ncbi:MAG: M48 family metallopeptidase [Leptospiraceae bacterium]|nr:M48 family metallopeptidase [Leptospiraceae bacterium]
MKSIKYRITTSRFPIDIEQKSMKSIRFTVYPPDGRVRVSGPTHLSRKQMMEVIQERMDWIENQRKRMMQYPRPSAPRYVEGERIFYMGKPYQVRIRSGSVGGVQFEDSQCILTLRKGTTAAQRIGLMENHFRSELRTLVTDFVSKWQPRMKVNVKFTGIKKMKTLWGSCNVRTGRIWINLELARYSPACIESIVVHEMVHLKERLHNARFYSWMNRFLPDWKEREKELKEARRC